MSDGFWVALDGLSPGRHTLEFGGTSTFNGGLTVAVFDTLVVPEPGTLSLLLLGAFAPLVQRRFGARVPQAAADKS